MQKDLVYRWGVYPLWLLLTATIFFRSPIPIDETRYLSVAWDMWLRGDFLVPYLNGQTYSHKPPLLFWLFHIGWAALGVNECWPRLVGPLAALLNLWLTRLLAQKLWPEQLAVALMAPWILIATLLWTLFATSTMFDILLTACVLLAMLGLLEASAGAFLKAWGCVALALGLGILAKGPVVLLHVLPTAALVFFWRSPGSVAYSRWFGGLVLAVLAGAAIALAWAIPAALAGGEEYANAILWHQTTDRAVGTRIHARSVIWYLPFLPMFLFPWFFWPRLWSSLRGSRFFSDNGLRFCLVWLTASFVLFSLLPSKQIHYLIPTLPAFALLAARVLTKNKPVNDFIADSVLPLLFGLVGVFLILLPQVPGLSKLSWVQAVQAEWGMGVLLVAVVLAVSTWFRHRQTVVMVSTALVVAICIGFVCFFQYTGLAYNLSPAAERVKAMHDQGVACIYVGNYQGQLNFLGRLTQPLLTLPTEQAKAWAEQHSDGYLISLEREKPMNAVYLQAHREYWLVFRSADQVAQLKPL